MDAYLAGLSLAGPSLGVRLELGPAGSGSRVETFVGARRHRDHPPSNGNLEDRNA
jgi:hypothetical protein